MAVGERPRITQRYGGNPANDEHAGFVAWGAEAVRYICEVFIFVSLIVISCSVKFYFFLPTCRFW